MCVGRGLGALGHGEFLLLFFGGCKYVCAALESQCRSKLNAEFSLFYSFSFSSPCFFCRKKEKKKSTVPSLQLYGSYLWVVEPV